jgi:hypothetical protein
MTPSAVPIFLLPNASASAAAELQLQLRSSAASCRPASPRADGWIGSLAHASKGSETRPCLRGACGLGAHLRDATVPVKRVRLRRASHRRGRACCARARVEPQVTLPAERGHAHKDKHI